MRKQLIVTAVAALVATTANAAGSSAQSKQGSSNMVDGVSASVTTTLTEISKGVASTVESTANLSGKLLEGSKFVIMHPSQASAKSTEAASKASTWLIETSANGSIAFIKDPSGSTSKALEASGRASKWTVTKSGEIITSTVDYVKETSGPASKMVVVDGSGEVLKATSGSTVVMLETSGAVLVNLGQSTLTVSKTSTQFASDLVAISATEFEASLNAVGRAFSK